MGDGFGADARTFWELLDERAAATPDRPMLLDPDGRSLTFAGVRERAERVAAGLAALGVGAGTPVTWQLPTRIETVVASFALCRLGAVQNPVIHLYREREVGFCLRQTRPALVLIPGIWGGFDYRAMVDGIVADFDAPPRILTLEDGLPEGDPATLPALERPDDELPVRWIYYTSGTTSDPKGVRHSDASLLAGGSGLARAIAMREDDVGSIAFPYAHIGGPDYVVAMLVSGFAAVLMERFDVADAVEVFRRFGVTMAGGSTAFYTMLLAEQRRRAPQRAFPTLRLLSGGGAPMPPEVYFDVKREMGIPVAHGYGMTECPMISQGGPGDGDDPLAHSEGAPIEGCRVAIVRSDETEAAPGETGEVRVTGPMVFRGYTDAALDRDAFDDAGRFRTGDLGFLREDGHLVLCGRLKDTIIRKGENISAQEVEEVLCAHPRVAAAAVIGLPDAERGERVCAIVEREPDQAPLGFDEMVAHCREAGLMAQKIPEQLEWRDALPRSATMKIQKNALRDELAG